MLKALHRCPSTLIAITVNSPRRRALGCLPPMGLLHSSSITKRSPKPSKHPTCFSSAAGPAPAPVRMVLVVAVALLDRRGRVLLAERPPGKAMAGLWEFPGGKVEAGETPEAALQRELEEELGVTAAAAALRPLTFASHTYAEQGFHLLMPLYACTAWEGTPTGREGQRVEWVDAERLQALPMPAADVPLLPPVLRAMAEAAADDGGR